MAIPAFVGSINVNSMNTNTIVSVGENSQTNWSTHNKNNYGTGQTYGISWILSPFNIIFDNDFIDTPISDPDFANAPQGQAL